MSSPLFIPLAEAVLKTLNAQEFSRPFRATRIYDALRQLPEMEQMRVDVLLGDRKSEPLDRSRMKNVVRIEIAVRQVIKGEAGSELEQQELDALVAFCEEIDDCLSDRSQRRLTAAPWAVWQGTEMVYPFLPQYLRGRQFTSLLRASYFVATGPLAGVPA